MIEWTTTGRRWPNSEVHYLTSAAAGSEFKIFVGHCPGRTPGSARVLYLTDANGSFGGAVDIIRGMQIAAQLPSLLVVGIGYRAGAIADTVRVRRRDLTPSADPLFGPPDPARMGGAADTLAFIRHQLMPWVAATFDVVTDDATFLGHSLGGLFGTWVLLTEPDTFARYLITSPSLWWDSYRILGHESAYADRHHDLAATVFFAIGADETLEGRIREAAHLPAELRKLVTVLPLDMVADLEAMIDRLTRRRYPSLSLHGAVFPAEFHVTVAPLALSRGLRLLFDAPR